jgi:hypothetical protein
MDVFLSNILGMLPVLGIHAFEPSLPKSDTGSPLLKCQGKGLSANGRDTTQGFIVQSGSHASKDITPSLTQYFPGTCDLRVQLLKNGVLVEEKDRLRFTQDYTFTSPSLAAQVVLGRSANGRTEWKDANGTSLKQLQEAQANR